MAGASDIQKRLEMSLEDLIKANGKANKPAANGAGRAKAGGKRAPIELTGRRGAAKAVRGCHKAHWWCFQGRRARGIWASAKSMGLRESGHIFSLDASIWEQSDPQTSVSV